MKNGIVVKARIIRHEGKWSSRGEKISYLYYPVVHFFSVDEREITVKLEFGTSLKLYSIGQIISIVYQKNNPFKATKYMPWLPMTILLGSIAIALLFHIFLFLFENGYLNNL